MSGAFVLPFLSMMFVLLSGSLALADDRPSLQQIVDRLVASAPFDKSSIQRILGVNLRFLAGDQTKSYEASNIKLNDAVIETVDYREKAEADEGEKFVLLRLVIKGACIKFSDIERVYGPLSTYLGAHMDVARAPAFFYRKESWGRLSFEYPAHESDCLTSVVFNRIK